MSLNEKNREEMQRVISNKDKDVENFMASIDDQKNRIVNELVNLSNLR